MNKTISATIAAMAFTASAFTASAESVSIVGLPTGFGLAGNVVSLGVTGSYGPLRGTAPNQTRFDASTSVLFGFGNPATSLGFEFGATLTSFRNFGASGYVDLGFHRMFQGDQSGIGSVSFRAAHIAPWGDSAALRPSYTLAGSYLTSMGGRLVMTTIAASTAYNNAREVRGAIGFGTSVAPDWSISAGYAGDHSVFGATWTPPTMPGASVSFSLSALESTTNRALVINFAQVFNLNR